MTKLQTEEEYVDDTPTCKGCGDEMYWTDCWNCDEDGYSHHECGEDTCVCLYPENNVTCEFCEGKGGYYICINSKCKNYVKDSD